MSLLSADDITRNGSKKDEDLVKLLNDLQENANVQAYLSDAGSGGAASEAMTVTGLKASDKILSVTQETEGAGVGKTMIAHSTLVADGLTIKWDADPGAGAKVLVLVRHELG